MELRGGMKWVKGGDFLGEWVRECFLGSELGRG